MLLAGEEIDYKCSNWVKRSGECSACPPKLILETVTLFQEYSCFKVKKQTKKSFYSMFQFDQGEVFFLFW